MIIGYLNVMGASVLPLKANTPLVVNAKLRRFDFYRPVDVGPVDSHSHAVVKLYF